MIENNKTAMTYFIADLHLSESRSDTVPAFYGF